MNRLLYRHTLLAASLFVFVATSAQALIQTSESFDANWPGVPWSSFSNDVVNPVSLWRVNQAKIFASATNSAPYGAQLPQSASPTYYTAWVQSPLLTNGIGSITFATKNVSASATVTFNVEYSRDAVTWITNGVVTNTSQSFIRYTNTLNTLSNGYLRLRKTSDGTGLSAYLDDISISAPPPIVTVSNVAIVPSAPQNGDSVYVTAAVSIVGIYDSLTVTARWMNAFGTWTSIPMTNNTQGLYVSSTPIPAQPVGNTIAYYVATTYGVDGNSFQTNLPSSSTPYTYTVRERSAYTNVSVIGSITTNLLLVSPGLWRTAIPAPGLTNPAIRFQTASNSVTTIWGDADPSVFTLPLYGKSEVGAGTILMSGGVSTPIAFSFDEQSGEYNVQPCVYENFDGWTNRPFGVYTNNGWVLGNGLITNDATRAFLGSQAILNGDPNAATNSYLLSPYLTNGIGQISLWLRNFETTGGPPAIVSIQKATSPASTNWSDIPNATTNTIATNYLYFSVTQADRDSHAIRFVNNAGGANARVCIDEVIICEPAAGVVVNNLTNSPGNPGILDDVDIVANIDAMGGATNLQVQAWFRFGTSGVFDAAAMFNDASNRFVTVTPIPHAHIGIVQYYIQCAYTGFLSAASSPVTFPTGGASAPYSYQASESASRTENFDTWPGAPWGGGGYSNNVVNPASGWRVNQTRIVAAASSSVPYGAQLNQNATPPGAAWIQSPFLTNGLGRLLFDIKNVSANVTNLINIEISPDGLTWITNSVITNTSTAFVRLTNMLDTVSNSFVRLRKTSDATGQSCYIDTIALVYPPAQVLVTNVFIDPGYPSTADTVNVSCVVTSLNPMFPAVNMVPTLYYRRGGDVAYSNIPMAHITGSQYSTLAGSIPKFPRDTRIEYFVRCDFNGYHGSDADNQSPTFYPADGSNAPNSYVVRAHASPYNTIGASVNGASAPARLLRDRTWQTVAKIETPTNRLSISLIGTGYSTGSGYATNAMPWGNTNNWQTALPLADIASTNQAAFAITGSFQGQYSIRFNEETGLYIIQKCVWQDFDTWPGTASNYVQSANDNSTPVSQNFDTWVTNDTLVRSESFAAADWTAMTSYTNGGYGGLAAYLIYGSKIASAMVQTRPTDVGLGKGFVVQGSSLGTTPLRGIGMVKASYKPIASSPATTFGIYLQPTNSSPNYDYEGSWVNLFTDSGLTNNAAFTTTTLNINTSTTYSVIFAHTFGDTNLYIDDLSVGEWYADTKTSNGWTATESWILKSLKPGNTNCCLFDATRADPGVPQYVQSPKLTNGVNTISFQYGGVSNLPASFDLQVSYGTPSSFASVFQQTNTFSGAGSNYASVAHVLKAATNSIYVRIVNTTPGPGVLLVDNIRISSYALPDAWAINNVAIDDSDPQTPPLPRQFYAGAAYLNSNRTANISTDDATKPASNLYPQIRSPYLADGIGEISFWYRNWTISGPSVTPAKLVVQASPISSTDDVDWTTIATLTNVVNTNDYIYFSTSVYDRVSHYVRIFNNDTTGVVGRVCLDDILATAPLAASLSMSNLTVSPLTPVYSNTVDVLVDVYQLFLNPSNITLKAFYGTATNYAGLTNATLTERPMSCIATNLSVPGKWYRYKTTAAIGTNAIDSFVRYYLTASYDGLMSATMTPKTNKTFGVHPSWYAPLDTVYGTNMAYYIVYSCPTGAAWFNELNYIDIFDGSNPCWTNEYIELAGVAGANLRGWTIEIHDADDVIRNVAQITNNYILPNNTNGHGFWVLGDAGVANVDMVFTGSVIQFGGQFSPYDAYQNLPYGGGLILKRSVGTIEQKIAYGDGISGWPPAVAAENVDATPVGALALTGSGTNYGDFAWHLIGYHSPHGANDGQSIYGGVTAQENNPPSITITAFWMNTNVWLVSTRTNGWYPAPWYSTNLLNTNSWTAVPVFSRSQTTTNATINFATPADTLPHFYAVNPTNSP